MQSRMRHFFISFLFLLVFPGIAQPTAPAQYFQPGFHSGFRLNSFPAAMRQARTAYMDSSNAINTGLFSKFTFRSPNLVQQGVDSLPYVLMTPPGYQPSDTTRFPLVIALHGSGFISSTAPPQPFGISRYMAIPSVRTQFPSFVVSPRLPTRYADNFPVPEPNHPVYRDPLYPNRNAMLGIYIQFIEYILSRYPVDRNRIYLNGYSHGGHGVRLLLSERPDLFAAGSISSGSVVLFQGGPKRIAENDIPLWNFGGVWDTEVTQIPLTSSYDSLTFYGSLDNIFWLIDELDHSDVSVTYRELIPWLFGKSKADRVGKPVARFTLPPTVLPGGVSLDGSGSTDPEGVIVSHQWEVSQSLKFTSGSTYSGVQAEHLFTEPGDFFIRLIVTDNAGKKAAKVQRIRVLEAKPTARFEFGRNYALTGEGVRFDASASVPEAGSTLTSFQWLFENGQSASGKIVVQAFSTPGTFPVRLIVESASGIRDTVVRQVTISASFPGYRYLRFIGTRIQPLFSYRAPEIHELHYKAGAQIIPASALTANQSGSVSIEANYEIGHNNQAFRAFDKNLNTRWQAHNYGLPAILTLDLGQGSGIVPTGMHLTMSNPQRTYTEFFVTGSVDKLQWDTLYRHPAGGGVLPDIQFPESQAISIVQPLAGTQFPEGSNILIRSATQNLNNVSLVKYLANNVPMGTSTQSGTFDFVWNNANGGTYLLIARAFFNGGADSVTSAGVSVQVLSPPVFSSLTITPSSPVVVSGNTLQFTATAMDQYGTALSTQPAFTWYVSSAAGTITPGGLLTAGPGTGSYFIKASAAVGTITLSDSVPVLISDSVQLCSESFQDATLRPFWRVVDKDNFAGSLVQSGNGKLRLTGRGSDLWMANNQYVALARNDMKENFDVSVRVDSLTNTHNFAKAGIMVAKNLDLPEQGGYAVVYMRPDNNGYRFQVNGTGSLGQINTTAGSADSSRYPSWLRLVKSGNSFSAFYKKAEASPWTLLGTASPQQTSGLSEVGLFISARNASQTGKAVFAGFQTEDCFGTTTGYSFPETGNRGEMQVYPKPEGDFFYLFFSRPEETIFGVRLTDLSGKRVLECEMAGHGTKISLRGLPAGVYWLSGFSRDGVFRKQILKD